jgi:excisionase family DNA binding protein
MKSENGYTFLTFNEAVKYSGVPKTYLYRAVRTKKVTHYKVGGRLLFKPIDIDNLLDNSIHLSFYDLRKAISEYIEILKGVAFN